jgi:hypothetical protein
MLASRGILNTASLAISLLLAAPFFIGVLVGSRLIRTL